nr:putative ribonuclease H-like domain-containing protein [Tanacetum cinerariifolium]
MKKIAIKEIRRKLEIAQKEKDRIQLTVDKLKNASKGLNKLIECQIIDNYEFVVKLVVENKSSEEGTKADRKNTDALIIKEWVSDDEKKNVTQPKIVKKTVRPSIVKKEFVKPRQQEKTTRKTIKKGIPQMDLQDKGVIASGCLRHMTWNISYITDYKEIYGGYVAFRGNPKGGKITRKYTIKTGTKDETSGILKSFITRIENLVDHKVKVIRCDNGTEFKNKEMNQFCKIKGSRPDWLFDTDALTRTMNYEPIVADPKSSQDDGFKPSSDDGKKVDEDLSKGNEYNELPFDPNMPALEDVSIFNFLNDDEDDDIMDVKSAFLYRKIEEEVYVCQPPGFEELDFPDRVYKVEKALYGLHQAPKAWYETLSTYLLDNGFQRGKTDKTLFIKREKGDILLVQFYVDDIIFSSTRKELCNVFERYQVNSKVSHLYAVKRIFRYLKGQPKIGLWYPKDSSFDLVAYTDSDYARASLDRKSTIKGTTYYCWVNVNAVEEQFWSTVVAKTINGEAQIHARVDGKKVIISEASIRRDLQYEDEEGFDCLPNSTIFEQLASMGMDINLDNLSGKFLMYPRNMRRIEKGFSRRITPLFPTMMVQSQLGEGSAMPTDPYHTPIILQSSSSQPQKNHKPGKPTRKITEVPQPSEPMEHVIDEAVHKKLGDSLTRVIDLEKTKTTQANEIDSLKRRVKKLERRNKSRTHKLKRLYKVGLTARVESSDNEESLVDDEMFDADKDLGGEEVFVEQEVVADKEKINEVTLVQALAELKTSKPKAKRVVIQEPRESPTTTTTIPKQKSQDNGKGIMVEKPMKHKKKDQIRLDEEVKIDVDHQLAKRLDQRYLDLRAKTISCRSYKGERSQVGKRINDIDADEDITLMNVQADAEIFDADKDLGGKEVFVEQEVIADKEKINETYKRESSKKIEANIDLIETLDDVQAKIDVDHQLAERLKFFAAKRAKEKRNKPPTQAQKRKIMCTYLKNMEGYILKQLKEFEFDKVQEMFNKAFKRVNTFEEFRTELVQGQEKEKRAEEKLIQKRAKKQKMKYNKEIVVLKQLMEIVPDKEEVVIDAILLAVNQMLESFDREDLYKLVKAKYGSTRPVEDLDLLVWGDLKTMFKPHVEDDEMIAGIKSLPDAVGITAAHVLVNAAQLELMLLVDNNEKYAKYLLLVVEVKTASTKLILLLKVSAAQELQEKYSK